MKGWNSTSNLGRGKKKRLTLFPSIDFKVVCGRQIPERHFSSLRIIKKRLLRMTVFVTLETFYPKCENHIIESQQVDLDGFSIYITVFESSVVLSMLPS